MYVDASSCLTGVISSIVCAYAGVESNFQGWYRDCQTRLRNHALRFQELSWHSMFDFFNFEVSLVPLNC